MSSSLDAVTGVVSSWKRLLTSRPTHFHTVSNVAAVARHAHLLLAAHLAARAASQRLTVQIERRAAAQSAVHAQAEELTVVQHSRQTARPAGRRRSSPRCTAPR